MAGFANQFNLPISVASAGDVNGDGYGDVILGDPDFDGGESQEGAAFIFLGSATGVVGTNPVTAHARLESNQASALMGWCVASAGDVNGDGYGDVIVGAEYYDAPEADEGAAFIFLGSAVGIANGNPATAHARIESNQNDARMGFSCASAGDVNGDGYGDVIVGAIQYSAPEPREGAAFLYLGSASGIGNGNPSNAHARFESNQGLAAMGIRVASAGDVNGDGFGDVIVSAHLYDAPPNPTDAGAAFVFLGSPSGIPNGNPTIAHAKLYGDVADGGLGSVASAGDVNGDGYGDVIVGTVTSGVSSPPPGYARVYHGSASGVSDEIADTLLLDAGYFGLSVASAGDLDGDGYGDVVVGKPGFGAYVFRGSATGVANADSSTASGRIQQGLTQAMGTVVAPGGDINGDGHGDLIVAANTFGAFVYLGNTKGRSLLAQQRRDDGTGRPIQPNGGTYDADSFQVESRISSPRGRERAKLEVEVCPLGSAFGAVACTRTRSPSWNDLGTSGAAFTQSIAGLTANTTYSWRVRALFLPYRATQPGITPIVRPGPWHRLQSRAMAGDVRTVPEPGIGVGLWMGLAGLGVLGKRRVPTLRVGSRGSGAREHEIIE